MVRGFRLVVNGVCARVGECRSARSIVTIYIVAVGERHGSAVYALSRRDDRCDLCLAGVIHAGCFHGNGQLRRFDLDGHSSGRSRVFLVARSRSERPFGFIAVICSWLGCAICPCKCAVDGCAGVGVFHLARNRALAQRVAVCDAGCGDFTVRYRCDFSHCVEIERQIEARVVIRGDINRDGSDLAGFPAIQCIDRQRQNAIFNRNVINVIPIFKIEREFTIIGYLAIGALGRFGQKLLGVIGVFQLRAVDHVQCADLDVRGRSGFVNFERLILQLRAVQRKVLLGRAVFKDIARIL